MLDCYNIFSTSDENLRVAANKKLLITAKMIYIFCLACMFAASMFLSYKIAVCINGGGEGYTPFIPLADTLTNLTKFISDMIFFLLSFVFIFVGFIITKFIYRRRLLKAYGLSKEVELWVINFEEEKICKIKPFAVDIIESEFNKTLFECVMRENGVNEYISINGKDIYFSKSSAKSVLKYIEEINDKVIEQYYPKWRENTDFILHYKEWQHRLPGPHNHSEKIEQKYSLIDMYILESVTINEIEYKPDTILSCLEPIDILLKTFIEKIKEKCQIKERQRQIKEQISEMCE